MDSKEKIDKNRLKIIHTFIENFQKLDNKDKSSYLKQISSEEIKYIEEVCYNFLHSNIKIENRKIVLLKRLKRFIYKFLSKTSSKQVKRKILSSIRGLFILNIIFPSAFDTIACVLI